MVEQPLVDHYHVSPVVEQLLQFIRPHISTDPNDLTLSWEGLRTAIKLHVDRQSEKIIPGLNDAKNIQSKHKTIADIADTIAIKLTSYVAKKIIDKKTLTAIIERAFSNLQAQEALGFAWFEVTRDSDGKIGSAFNHRFLVTTPSPDVPGELLCLVFTVRMVGNIRNKEDWFQLGNVELTAQVEATGFAVKEDFKAQPE
ncbi:hypothetical protein BN14_03757 [Rhizoctonia solani AG-1 IB]|uniref:Uncharacterized protein n=1 Tax=Thanatephorus cucumeris (strain AG1-IB / isolate 7/3/14) TaxID=1108050 RepID=M5BPQ2_THACB|nr:hypothetical protein BN14_03757 [Rhizoctonia solani AG-1 IB]